MRTFLTAGLLAAALAGPLVAQAPAPAERKLQIAFDRMGNVAIVAQSWQKINARCHSCHSWQE